MAHKTSKVNIKAPGSDVLSLSNWPEFLYFYKMIRVEYTIILLKY